MIEALIVYEMYEYMSKFKYMGRNSFCSLQLMARWFRAGCRYDVDWVSRYVQSWVSDSEWRFTFLCWHITRSEYA